MYIRPLMNLVIVICRLSGANRRYELCWLVAVVHRLPVQAAVVRFLERNPYHGWARLPLLSRRDPLEGTWRSGNV